MSWNEHKTCKLVRAAGGGVDPLPRGIAPVGRSPESFLREREVFGLMVLRSNGKYPFYVDHRGAKGIGSNARGAAKSMEKRLPQHSSSFAA